MIIGKDIHEYDISQETDGDRFVFKAKNKENNKNSGSLIIHKNAIIKFSVANDMNPSFELLLFACGVFDTLNQPIMADENGMSLQASRLFASFGFRGGEDSILMRRPYAVLPATNAQPNIPKNT